MAHFERVTEGYGEVLFHGLDVFDRGRAHYLRVEREVAGPRTRVHNATTVLLGQIVPGVKRGRDAEIRREKATLRLRGRVHSVPSQRRRLDQHLFGGSHGGVGDVDVLNIGEDRVRNVRV